MPNSRYQRLLHDSLVVSAGRSPHKVAIVAEGTPYTYEALLDGAVRLSNQLRAYGVKRGDRVAIYMDNTWPCVVSLFGTMMAGGAFLVVNPQTKADKLKYILNDSEASVLITDGHLSKIFLPVLDETPSVKRVVCSGALPHANREILAFDECLAAGDVSRRRDDVVPVDLAALIYTSGSTGNPKGVMMTHQAMAFTAGSLTEYLRLDETDRILNLLPVAFDYGLYQLLMTVRLGATLVLERSFTYSAQIVNRVKSEQVTVFPGVPTVYMTLLAMHARSPLSFPSVRRITNTAAALSSDIVPTLRQIFPNALVFLMYGLTECKRVCYLEPELVDAKPGSVGHAIPGTEVFLLSADNKPVAPGEAGILHVRGPHVMLGYWNQPRLSAHMLKAGRWPGERVLCSHDLFRMDEDGCLYFLGRSDDIIKTRGEKVSPVEVENCLHGIPGVREAAVIGIPDELLGEAIRAYVALNEGVTLSDKDIRSYCMARLENFMVPKEIVFLPELPKTATGKIRQKGSCGDSVTRSVTSHTYEQLLAEVKASLKPLPDKPEETTEGLLNALWLTAAGVPTSVENAKWKPLPELSSEGHSRLRLLLDKRFSGVPLAHLTERQSFLGVELIAGPGALIPRKETEIVGRAALSRLKTLVAERGQALVLDVCTGSGNLALAYAFSEPGCRVLGADLSQEAVDLAKRNLQFTGLGDRVEFRQGNLLDPFESPEFMGKADLVSCNPPYMSSGKVPAMAREISAFEPELAFNGGAFGVSIITKLIRNAPRFLKPASWLCFEVGLGQGPALAKQLQKSEVYSEVETHLDPAGEIRALSARTKSLYPWALSALVAVF